MTLAVLTVIAALCSGNRECIRNVRQCFDARYTIALCALNICEKSSVWNDCSKFKRFNKADEIYTCWEPEVMK